MSGQSDRALTVWILNHYAATPDMAGGTRHYDLGVELVRRGNQVVIFASSFSHGSHEYIRKMPSRGWTIEPIDGIDWVWLSTCAYSGNNLWRLRGMFQYERRVKRTALRLLESHGIPKPDVIVGSTVHPFAARAGAYLARALRVPFVFEVRDLWPETLVDMGVLSRDGFLAKSLAGIEQRLCRESSGIVVLPDKAVDYYSQLGVPGEKMIWIPNCVYLEESHVGSSSRQRHDTTFSVVYTGSIGANDGMRNAVEAWTELERRGVLDIRLTFYGDGNEKAALMNLVQSRGLKSVSFEPRVPKDQVPAILDSASAALMCLLSLPLYRYGVSPNKLGDYMAASKPIICSSDWPITAMDFSGCAIRCAADDPSALADAVLHMRAKSDAERAAMGRAGRAYAEHMLGVREVGGRLEAGLRRVINGQAITDEVTAGVSQDT